MIPSSTEHENQVVSVHFLVIASLTSSNNLCQFFELLIPGACLAMGGEMFQVV